MTLVSLPCISRIHGTFLNLENDKACVKYFGKGENLGDYKGSCNLTYKIGKCTVFKD